MMNHSDNYFNWGMHMGLWVLIIVVFILIIGWFSLLRKRK